MRTLMSLGSNLHAHYFHNIAILVADNSEHASTMLTYRQIIHHTVTAVVKPTLTPFCAT